MVLLLLGRFQTEGGVDLKQVLADVVGVQRVVRSAVRAEFILGVYLKEQVGMILLVEFQVPVQLTYGG